MTWRAELANHLRLHSRCSTRSLPRAFQRTRSPRLARKRAASRGFPGYKSWRVRCALTAWFKGGRRHPRKVAGGPPAAKIRKLDVQSSAPGEVDVRRILRKSTGGRRGETASVASLRATRARFRWGGGRGRRGGPDGGSGEARDGRMRRRHGVLRRPGGFSLASGSSWRGRKEGRKRRGRGREPAGDAVVQG